jgi:hypothetical protein
LCADGAFDTTADSRSATTPPSLAQLYTGSGLEAHATAVPSTPAAAAVPLKSPVPPRTPSVKATTGPSPKMKHAYSLGERPGDRSPFSLLSRDGESPLSGTVSEDSPPHAVVEHVDEVDDLGYSDEDFDPASDSGSKQQQSTSSYSEQVATEVATSHAHDEDNVSDGFEPMEASRSTLGSTGPPRIVISAGKSGQAPPVSRDSELEALLEDVEDDYDEDEVRDDDGSSDVQLTPSEAEELSMESIEEDD